MMRGGKSPKLADKGTKKAPPVGQASRGSVGDSGKTSNGGSQMTGKKRKKKKDKQLPPSCSSADSGKGALKEPVKVTNATKTTSQVGSGKFLEPIRHWRYQQNVP